MCQAYTKHFVNITSFNLKTTRWVTKAQKAWVCNEHKSTSGREQLWASDRHLGPQLRQNMIFFSLVLNAGRCMRGNGQTQLLNLVSSWRGVSEQSPLDQGQAARRESETHRDDAPRGVSGVEPRAEPAHESDVLQTPGRVQMHSLALSPPLGAQQQPLWHNRLPGLMDSYLLYFPWCSFADLWAISEYLVC